ncbi:BMC domain-containing protein, partial [Moorena sp. SIO2C4]|uniref:BMC domain-containing protein n=1 Tax=Moorena sp. SIO2C4 TaxID=2607824 RepID=UPI0013C88F33
QEQVQVSEEEEQDEGIVVEYRSNVTRDDDVDSDEEEDIQEEKGMVGASDAMLKAANVQLTAYETIGAGLCTAIIRGRVADVAVALQVGMAEAQRIGELTAVTVIPRPLEDLEKSLPVASCLMEEQPQPLRIPVKVKEAEKELVELPDLRNLPIRTKDS